MSTPVSRPAESSGVHQGSIGLDDPAHSISGSTPPTTEQDAHDSEPIRSFGFPPTIKNLWQDATHQFEEMRRGGAEIAGHLGEVAEGFAGAAYDAVAHVKQQAGQVALDMAHAALGDQPAKNDAAQAVRTMTTDIRAGTAKVAAGIDRAADKLSNFAAQPIGHRAAPRKPGETEFLDDLNHIAVGGAETVAAAKPVLLPAAGAVLTAAGLPVGPLVAVAVAGKANEGIQAAQVEDYTGVGAAAFGVTTVVAGGLAVKFLRERNALKSQLQSHLENNRLEGRPPSYKEALGAEARSDQIWRKAQRVPGMTPARLAPLEHQRRADYSFRVAADARRQVAEISTNPSRVSLGADADALRGARLQLTASTYERAGTIAQARAALAKHQLKFPGPFKNDNAGEQAAKLQSQLDLLDRRGGG